MVNELDTLREQIDHLDKAMLKLLTERGKLVQEVGAVKEKNGQPIFNPGRERDLLQRLKKENRGPLSDEDIEAVFGQVVHVCRGLQKELVVAYFGPEATFTQMAAIKSFGRRAQFVAARTISDVFAEVEKRRADFGVVPVENSTEGMVNHTLDMFINSSLSICAETEISITQNLLGRKTEKPKVLYVHYQALAQCRQWVEANLPEIHIVEATSTAESAKLASKKKGGVAIASKLAAELYGLDMIASGIEDASQNFTRFLVIGSTEAQPTGRDKTSILFSIKDKVGALHEMLGVFEKFGLNLTKIESRPTRQRAWEYVFFVDFLGHRLDKQVQKALAALEKSCVLLRVLGSYPRGE